jgi:broad specificity phosphatase PhoE
MLILAARHGDTDIPGHCRGRRTDCSLSPLGKEQTDRNVRAMEQAGVKILYTSTLTRAMYAGVLGEERGMKHVILDDLDAIDAGEWEGLSWKEIAARWPEQLALCDTDATKLVIPGGRETVEVFSERVLRALERMVVESRGKHETIGTVTHGCVLGVIRGAHPEATRTVLRDKDVPTGSLFEVVVDEHQPRPVPLSIARRVVE